MARRMNLAIALPPPRRSADLRPLALAVRERILNRVRSFSGLDGSSTYVDSQNATAQFERIEIIRSVLKGLPNLEREVLRLYYIAGRTMAEIGKDLNLPEDKVRRIKDAAKRRLRRAFEVRDIGRTTDSPRPVSVISHAIAVFGDERKASHWLGSPLPVLGGRSPAQALAEDGDVSVVDRILTRIEHNIPS
jgi:uncharacterized protein (DUF2384 family)